MRYRIHTHMLVFLLIVCCGTAAAQESTAPLDENLLMQRVLDYDQQVDKKTLLLLNDYVRYSEETLTALYPSLWRRQDMPRKLTRAVAAGVDFAEAELELGAKAKFIWDKKTREEVSQIILEQTLAEFSPKYDAFLDAFLDTFSKDLLQRLQEYHRELTDYRLEKSNFLPGYKALADYDPEVAVSMLTSEIITPDVKPRITPWNFKGTITAVTYLIIKKRLAAFVKQRLARLGMRALGTKAAALLEGPVGWVVGILSVGYDIYGIGKELYSVPDKLKPAFTAALSEAFLDRAPGLFRREMREQIAAEYSNVVLLTDAYDDAVMELGLCPSFIRQAESLPEAEQEGLVKRLLLLKDKSGRDMCTLMRAFGAALLSIPPGRLHCPAEALGLMSPTEAARWIKIAGLDFCDFMELGLTDISRFEPSTESARALKRLTQLPPDLRERAVAMTVPDIYWMSENLDDQERIRLLRNRTPYEVQAEIERLSALPEEDREVRSKVMPEAVTSGARDLLQGLRDRAANLSAWMRGLFIGVAAILGLSLLAVLVRWLRWLKRSFGG